MKTTIILLAKTAVTGGLLAVLIWRVEPETLYSELQTMFGPTLVIATIITTLQMFVASVRWHVILHGLGIRQSLLESIKIFWIGIFFNNCAPGGMVGDGIRTLMIRRNGAHVAKGLNSVLLDRAVGIVAFALWALASLFMIWGRAGYGVAAWAIVTLTTGGCVGLALLGVTRRLPNAWMRYRAARALLYLANDFRKLVNSVGHAGATMVLAAMAPLLSAVSVWFLFRSLNVGISVIDCLVLLPPVIVSLTLPISIGGWGVREGAMVAVFSMAGVPPAASISVSIVTGILVTLICLPGGIIWMLQRGGRQIGRAKVRG